MDRPSIKAAAVCLDGVIVVETDRIFVDREERLAVEVRIGFVACEREGEIGRVVEPIAVWDTQRFEKVMALVNYQRIEVNLWGGGEVEGAVVTFVETNASTRLNGERIGLSAQSQREKRLHGRICVLWLLITIQGLIKDPQRIFFN